MSVYPFINTSMECTVSWILEVTVYVRYLTWITYLFPQTCRIGFPQVAARQSAGARAAIRGSPARQCADCPRGNARIIRGSVQSSADERGSVHT